MLLRAAEQGVGRRARLARVGRSTPCSPTRRRRTTSAPRAVRTESRRRRRPRDGLLLGNRPSSAPSHPALGRRVFAEYLGSLLLAAVVIGSGIAAQALSPDALGLELLENAAATAAGLYVLILMMGPVSGAHFNPVVSLVDAASGGLRWRDVPWYVSGPGRSVASSGAVVANLMFSRSAVSISTHHRASTPTCSPKWSPPPV